MTKRGKVLRDPHAGPGLVMAEGRQYLFLLEVWKSDAPPKPGLAVDLDLDEQGRVRAIYVVPEWQLAQEQAATTGQAGRKRPSAPSFISPFGIAVVLGTVLLAIAWWFLPAFTVQSPLFGRLEFTFWQGLGFLGSHPELEVLDQRGPSAGIYGAAAIAALAGPFLVFLWKDRRPVLAGVLPLLFTAIAGIAVYSAIVRTGGIGARPTLGLGSFAAALASLYLAFLAIRQFVGSRPVETPESPRMRKAA